MTSRLFIPKQLSLYAFESHDHFTNSLASFGRVSSSWITFWCNPNTSQRKPAQPADVFPDNKWESVSDPSPVTISKSNQWLRSRRNPSVLLMMLRTSSRHFVGRVFRDVKTPSDPFQVLHLGWWNSLLFFFLSIFAANFFDFWSKHSVQSSSDSSRPHKGQESD